LLKNRLEIARKLLNNLFFSISLAIILILSSVSAYERKSFAVLFVVEKAL